MDKHRIFKGSRILEGLEYAPRGRLLTEALKMIGQGFDVYFLNLGNPPRYDVLPPEEVMRDLNSNIWECAPYSDDFKGIFSARKAIIQDAQNSGIDVNIEDIYLTDGTTGAFTLAIQALINPGDEVLLPTPDYPAWTFIVQQYGGRVVRYLCDEKSEWLPDISDLEKKITSKTIAIVIISPNNPTGAVYPKDILLQTARIARKYRLVIISDEIYSKILFGGAKHISIASLANDILIITLNGLAKNYRLPGLKAGWLMISGGNKIKRDAQGFIRCLDKLASKNLCANMPGQRVIQTCLGGRQSINDLVAPGGQLYRRRKVALTELKKIPGISFVPPRGAFYVFFGLDPKRYQVHNDAEFCLQLLQEKKVLLIPGTGFNWIKPDHIRLVFLEKEDRLKEAIRRLAEFLEEYNNV